MQQCVYHCWSKPCNVLTCLMAQVNGYPSSPFDTTKLVFSKPYRKLVTLDDSIKTGKGDIPCDEVRLRRFSKLV